ncbi:MAG: hypothetical protein ACTHK2_17195 [Dokdonella sp.]|uniref:hypothetical protein n=1 Tax=Dokdonella sp. TaxID=2291710 RepID=UPI003F820344
MDALSMRCFAAARIGGEPFDRCEARLPARLREPGLREIAASIAQVRDHAGRGKTLDHRRRHMRHVA